MYPFWEEPFSFRYAFIKDVHRAQNVAPVTLYASKKSLQLLIEALNYYGSVLFLEIPSNFAWKEFVARKFAYLMEIVLPGPNATKDFAEVG